MQAENWRLTLVILRKDELSELARKTVEDICCSELSGCDLRIVYADEEEDMLETEGIFAIPTLIRECPAPRKKIIGSLSIRRVILRELGLTENAGPR